MMLLIRRIADLTPHGFTGIGRDVTDRSEPRTKLAGIFSILDSAQDAQSVCQQGRRGARRDG
jgi:hypothetical protein